MRTAERVATALVVVAIAAASVVLLQRSFHFIGRAPYLAVDDSIPNVAVSLAQHGRYGFLASPTQGPHEVDRTYAFYNYGPAYFLVAAGLTWLVGPSLVLFRMLHPLGMVAIVLLGVLLFRRVSLIGPAVLCLGLFERYFMAQAPIARPDISVSVFAALMFVCAAYAIRRDAIAGWFGAGCCAASAVASHQIAIAVVPAAGVIWLWTVLAKRQEWADAWRRRAVSSLVAVVAGGAAGSLVYLAAIDFRIRDLLELGSAGVESRAAPFVPTVKAYFNTAWYLLPGWSGQVLILSFIGAALTAAACGLLRPSERRTRALAFVMPPVVVAVLYQLSVGFWGSVSAGYTILSQVTTWWAVAAFVAVVAGWLRESLGRVGAVVHIALLCAASVAVVSAEANWLRTPGRMQASAVGAVDMNDYIREVVAPMPERASVWGTLAYGVDAGDRTDLVQFQQGNPALDTTLDRRDGIAPNFLALGAYEMGDAFALTIAGLDSAFRNLSLIFPRARYRQLKLVSAPPYGNTAVHTRIRDEGPAPASIPEVAINDGLDRQWHSRVSASPLPVVFSPTDDVTAEVHHYALHERAPALAARTATLPAGFYLIEVALDRAGGEPTGFILASRTPHFVWQENPDLPVTPYFPGDEHIFLIVDHWGGPLFVSRFEKRGAHSAVASGSFDVRSVRPIERLANGAPRARGEVPSVGTWTPNPQVTVESLPEGQFRIDAPTGVWRRLTSPLISVAAGTHMVLTVSVGGTQMTTVGVLDEKDAWLVEPVVQPRRVAFDTRAHGQIRIALDSGASFDVHTAPQLTVVGGEGLYVDRLIACRSPYLPRSPDCKPH